MTAIDLIVLGMLRNEALSAYDLQKLVEYRNISKWVKISTPSIYKKVLQLEEKGLISSHIEKEGKMPEKAVYALTDEGKEAFETLMLELSRKPISFLMDFNAVIVNVQSLPKQRQKECLDNIQTNIKELKAYLRENLDAKEKAAHIPPMGMAVLRQQLSLAETIEEWMESLKVE